MDNIFMHDAIPTWSGFIYQGEIAVYLAVKKICELRDQDKIEINEIGSNYQIEVENCEDVAIVKVDKNSKQYISIHQVKNQKDKNIGSYRSPLVQLMLEKGYHIKEKMGCSKAYLHVSNKICENSENEINRNLEEWIESIQNFYNSLKTRIVSIDVDNNEIILQEIKKLVHEEPIKLNRSEYNKGLIKKIEDICNKENKDIVVLKQELQKLIDFLEQKLGVDYIDKDVQVYKYEDGKKFCTGTDVFQKIVEQVKRYKQNDINISMEQYDFIADMLLHYMRQHVIERHQKKQEGDTCEKSFALSFIIDILNNSLSDYEKEANVLALRRLYDKRLSQYCVFECGQTCLVEEGEVKICKLKQNEYRRVDLCDKDFEKLCYSFNPDCYNTIFERICLNGLLNENGLAESVFAVLKNVPERFFMKKNDKTRFIINNKKNNAFLTAISSKNCNMVVQAIVQGIENNAELVSPIFEADQLITTRLEADESVWYNDYSEIQKKYRSNQTATSEDNNQNSICMPKKPMFIKAETIINNCTNLESEVRE